MFLYYLEYLIQSLLVICFPCFPCFLSQCPHCPPFGSPVIGGQKPSNSETSCLKIAYIKY